MDAFRLRFGLVECSVVIVAVDDDVVVVVDVVVTSVDTAIEST